MPVQVPAAPQQPADLGSLFDELSQNDIDRMRNVKRAAPEETMATASSHHGSVAADYLARAAASGRRKNSKPGWVTTAQVALGISGGLSLFSACFIVIMISMFPVAPDEATRSFRPIIMMLGVFHAVLGVLSAVAIFNLQARTSGARILGFVAAGASILGSPVHIVCGIFAILGLVQSSTVDYLNQ